MRLITVHIHPSVPGLTVEDLASVLGVAGVQVEHVYADVSDAASRIAVYVRMEAAEAGPTVDAVIGALTPVAGEDRLVQARTHSWAEVAGETLP